MRRLSALAFAAGVLALAGCGSSSTPSTPSTSSTTTSTSTTTSAPATTTSSSSTTSAAQSLSLEANREGRLEYNTKSLTASAGKVTIDMTNMSPLMHNVTVESSSGKVLGATPTFQGGSKSLTLNLKLGVYKFYCSVPGHRAAGMEGTLTVK
ncbi:MAG TPA: plastocyanin/azurin family copper-binding protein [Solirubrobacteraceae bacterium]|nr:plastocyanin/azurin family copper-binding protein [Solirubrobacteraceae bacterium]